MVQTELIELTKKIAFYLNVGEQTEVWRFQKPRTDEGLEYPSQTIEKTSDLDCQIHIRIETYGASKGRVEVSGNFHIAKNEFGNSQFEDVREYGINGHSALPSISVAGTRGAEAIAKEIKRRFLPEYLPLLIKAQAKRDDRLNYYAKVRKNLTELGAIVGADMTRLKLESCDLRTYSNSRAYVDIHSNDTGVTDLKITNLTFEQAKRVLAIVAEERISDAA